MVIGLIYIGYVSLRYVTVFVYCLCFICTCTITIISTLHCVVTSYMNVYSLLGMYSLSLANCYIARGEGDYIGTDI